jgi:hypothetical protein
MRRNEVRKNEKVIIYVFVYRLYLFIVLNLKMIIIKLKKMLSN